MWQTAGCEEAWRVVQVWWLEDVGDDFFAADHGAGGFDVAGAGAADAVGDEAVFLGVDDVEEFEPELVEAVGFEAAFEDGVLDADAVVFTDFGDALEAFVVADVIGHDGKHLFFSRWFVWVLIGCEGKGVVEPVGGGGRGWHGGRSVHEEGEEGFAGEDGFFELEALVEDQAAEGGAVSGEFVGELAFEAAFILDEEFAAAFLGEEAADGALTCGVVGRAVVEVVRLEHAVGEEVDGEGVANGCAEGFEEVEGEGGAAVFDGVVGAEGGVEAGGPEYGFDFCGEDGVGVG